MMADNYHSQTRLTLSFESVAAQLGWSKKTLQNRLPALGLPYVKVGRSVVFLPEDLDAFLRRHRVANDCLAAVPQAKRGRGRPKGSHTRREHPDYR